MKIHLKYFTGTGNSLKILRTCENEFNAKGYQTEISSISTEAKLPESDLLGFCFPVYAFGIPRICVKYLKQLKSFQRKQKVFVLITAGRADESGFAIKQCKRLLEKKNCELIYSEVVEMPINWTTSPIPPYPPTAEEAKIIINKAIIQTKQIADNILKGIIKHHTFNFPKRNTKVKFLSDYFLFKHLGIQHMWRYFSLYETCNGCGICDKICPTNSIEMIAKKPQWSNGCEQCMRCVNYCPKEAIYQSPNGKTKNRHKYHEPDFNPTKNE